jgi:hypothetical protein
MKSIIILVSLIIGGCSITPQIISPKKQEMQQPTPRVVVKEGGWGWILWYIPIASIAIMWGYKEIIKKKDKKD